MIKQLFSRLTENRLGRIQYGVVEWAFMRLLFGSLLWMAGKQLEPDLLNYDQIRDQHGLGLWFDITFVGQPPWETLLPALYKILVFLYVINLFPLLSITGLFVIYTLMGTFFMSQGAAHHGQQAVGLLLLGQWLSMIWHLARSGDWRQWVFSFGQEFRTREVFWSQQMLAAAYVVTGLTKVLRSEFKWIAESPNLVVQFEKNLLMDYYNRLEPPDDRMTMWMVDFIERFPLLAQIGFGGILLLELLAFFALWNRPIMALWGLGLIAMHLTIGVVMKLHFLFNELALLIFFVNLPFWILWAIGKFTKK